MRQCAGYVGNMKSTPLFIIYILAAILLVTLAACTPANPALATVVSAEAATHPATAPTVPATPAVSAGWPVDDPLYSLSVDPSVAQSISVDSVPAVPPSPDIMFVDAHPAYLRFRLAEPMPGRMPYPHDTPQVLFLQTQDFASYGADTPAGFPNQLTALQQILETGLDPQRCAHPLTGPADVDVPLPFLSWVNAQQVFCAQPKVVPFQGGLGLRYLTFYAQGPNPVLDSQVFYTFQGLSANGRVYVSVMLPVKTGIFPEQLSTPPAAFPDPTYLPTLAAQLQQLNAQPQDAFQPALGLLDGVIQSIVVK